MPNNCPFCTFSNPSAATKCEICEEPIKNDKAWNRMKHLIDEEESFKREQKEAEERLAKEMQEKEDKRIAEEL